MATAAAVASADKRRGSCREEVMHFKHVFTRINDKQKVDDYFEFDKKLGEGSYGLVTRAKDKSTGSLRAIKKIEVDRISDPSRFEQEVDIQRQLDHPNIVKLYEVYRDAKLIYLVMELCSGGELFDRIVTEAEKHTGQAFNERVAATYMAQILGAIHYLHQHSFVHRDIKPENFLLQSQDAKAQIKVIDFGLAKTFRQTDAPMKTKAGTPFYVAPEVLGTKGYNQKCDIWSCGVIAYILLCGYPPFYGDNDAKILKSVKSGKFDFPEQDWDHISDECKDMIRKMLTRDPNKRISAGELLEHTWLHSNMEKVEGHIAPDFSNKLRLFKHAGKLKKVALTCIAQQLKDEDITELCKTFQILDNNMDGTLTPAEIKDGMQRHKIAIPPDMEEMVNSLDSDGSGVIDYSEFIAATLTTKQYLRKDAMWAAFRVFDYDGDASISREELRDVLGHPSIQELDALIEEVDTNKDGKIQFDEFCRMMEKGIGDLTMDKVEK